MKTYLVAITVLLSVTAQGQTWSEWFQQKKTQIRYLGQQIAALQVYIGYVKKGYEIADKGLSIIGNIKDGEFNLHRDFFSSLSAINPRIRSYARVAELAVLQVKMVQTHQRSIQALEQSGQFTPVELEHVSTVFLRVVQASMDHLEELVRLLQPGDYALKDDERIARIEQMQMGIRDKARMIQQYARSNLVLAAQRSREAGDVKRLKEVYGF